MVSNMARTNLLLIIAITLVFITVSQGATWRQFFTKHVLTPNENRFNNWNRDDWNAWIRKRLQWSYGTKNINSVIAESPDNIVNSFKESKTRHPGGYGLFWSTTRFPVYVVKLVKGIGSYDVFYCGKQYVLAGLDPETKLPVHFHRNYPTRLTYGNIQSSNTNMCRRIQ